MVSSVISVAAADSSSKSIMAAVSPLMTVMSTGEEFVIARKQDLSDPNSTKAGPPDRTGWEGFQIVAMGEPEAGIGPPKCALTTLVDRA